MANTIVFAGQGAKIRFKTDGSKPVRVAVLAGNAVKTTTVSNKSVLKFAA